MKSLMSTIWSAHEDDGGVHGQTEPPDVRVQAALGDHGGQDGVAGEEEDDHGGEHPRKTPKDEVLVAG